MKLFNILKEDLHHNVNENASDKETVSDNIPVSKDGLTAKEAKIRLDKYGLNQLSGKKQVHALQIFAGQFKDFFDHYTFMQHSIIFINARIY